MNEKHNIIFIVFKDDVCFFIKIKTFNSEDIFCSKRKSRYPHAVCLHGNPSSISRTGQNGRDHCADIGMDDHIVDTTSVLLLLFSSSHTSTIAFQVSF